MPWREKQCEKWWHPNAWNYPGVPKNLLHPITIDLDQDSFVDSDFSQCHKSVVGELCYPHPMRWKAAPKASSLRCLSPVEVKRLWPTRGCLQGGKEVIGRCQFSNFVWSDLNLTITPHVYEFTTTTTTTATTTTTTTTTTIVTTTTTTTTTNCTYKEKVYLLIL